MASDRIRVSRDLYLRALDDAIDWQQSLLETQRHDEMQPGGGRCCTPKDRCTEYKETAGLLARYRKAQTAAMRGSTSAKTGPSE